MTNDEDPDEDIVDGWDWGMHEEDGERCLPRITQHRAFDPTLCDQPPIGWWKVIHYELGDLADFRDVALWACCLAATHDWEHQSQLGRMHRICRTHKGGRVLVVDPALRSHLHEEVEMLNDHLNGTASHCGGWETIEHELQVRAGRLLLRRAARRVDDPFLIKQILASEELDPELADWQDLDVHDRIKLVELHPYLGMEQAFSAVDWADILPHDSGTLFSIYEKVLSHAGGPPRLIDTLHDICDETIMDES